MRFAWKGRWRGGQIVIEAETLEELNIMLDELFALGETPTSQTAMITPVLPKGLGCSDAIKALLKSEWGSQPRAMAEIKGALETNALFFSKGSISGTLRFLTKRGDIKRFKSAGKWLYTTKKN
jgi:hypothetical protein